MVERAYFLVCLALGRLFRSARYSAARVDEDQVRKRRSLFAPLLIWLGGPLLKLMDTGVRILPRREWQERERLIYQTLYGTSIRADADGTLVLPVLPGQTLAKLLERPDLSEPDRMAAITRAVVALAEFHRRRFTHADAMAENVMVEFVARPVSDRARPGSYVARPVPQGRDDPSAHWFDFETVHDSSRPLAWCRADDLRALLTTCLIRSAPSQRAGTLTFILDAYADDDVTRVLATMFATVWRRSLPFHLAQAPLSFDAFREIGRLLSRA